jgi:hypothetical protein
VEQLKPPQLLPLALETLRYLLCHKYLFLYSTLLSLVVEAVGLLTLVVVVVLVVLELMQAVKLRAQILLLNPHL